MFEKFLEDSEIEGDKDTYASFDSSKVTKVLKVFLSKSQKRVVAKCETQQPALPDASAGASTTPSGAPSATSAAPTKQIPIYLLKDCHSTVFIDFMKKLIYQAMSAEMKEITYKKLLEKEEAKCGKE